MTNLEQQIKHLQETKHLQGEKQIIILIYYIQIMKSLSCLDQNGYISLACVTSTILFALTYSG